MKRCIAVSFILPAILFAIGCQNASSPTNTAASNGQSDVRPAAETHSADDDHKTAARISLEDAKKEFDEGTAVFVDTHMKQSYDAERIKGALNMMTTEVDAKMSELPKDKKIIAYCSCADEHTSGHLVAALKEKGFDNAFALVGGTRAWRNAGYPMEGTLVKEYPSK